MRPTILLILLGFCGTNIQAQKLSVSILVETPETQRIAQAVAARIGSTARYTAHIGIGSGELSLDLMCFTMEEIVISRATQGMDGYVCAYHTTYYPAQLFPLRTLLGTEKLQSGTFAQVVEQIFDDFVPDTTDEKLQAAANELIQNASSFCRNHKDMCKTEHSKGTETGDRRNVS